MDQEKILNLIFDKLESIDKEQKLTNVKINKLEDRLDEVENSLEKNSVDIKEILSIQSTIKDFMLSTEKAIEVYEKDHKLIEKLKKVAGE